MRRTICLLGIFFLLAAIFVPANQAEARIRSSVRVSLSASSGYDWVNIYVQGRSVGQLRRGSSRIYNVRNMRLRGSVRVRVEARRGSYRSVKYVMSRFGRPAQVVFTPPAQKGQIAVTFSRSSQFRRASLYVSGRNRGIIRRGQQRTFSVDAGYHNVRIFRGSVSKTVRVRVTAGRTVYATIKLRRRERFGTLELRYDRGSRYRWANVRVDGRDKGRIRRGRTRRFRLKEGRHTVVVERGRLRVRRSFEIRENRYARINVRLRPRVRRGTLEVKYSRRSRYAWGNLLVDGRDKGRIRRGQTRIFRLRVGRHTVRIERRGRSVRKSVEINRNQTTRVRLAMRRRRGTIRVTLEQGSYVAYVTVYINGQSKGRLYRGRTTRYRYRAGVYRIRLDGNDGVSYRRRVTVRTRRTSEINVKL